MPSPLLHPFSGEFRDPLLETEFRRSQQAQTVQQQRLSLQVIALLFLFFGVLVDYQVMGVNEGFFLLAVLRAAAALGCLLMSIALGRNPSLSAKPLPLNLALFFLATVSILIVPLRPETANVQVTAAVALLFTLYLFVPNRMGWMVAQGAYLSLGFLAASLAWGAVLLERTGALFLILLLPNLIGYLYALRFGRLQREQHASWLAERAANTRLHREIAERQRLEGELRQLAQVDDLTGLNNRRWFLELAENARRHCRRRGTRLSLCMLDLDHFKSINDRHGHSAGDSILTLVASLCLEELRETDIIGRYGGEEFIIALPDADTAEARVIAERLRSRIAEADLPPEFSGLRLTATLGISQVEEAETSLEPALLRADQALYTGKREGRDRVMLASEDALH